MAQAIVRKLIFRLGEVGFLLDIEQVVEICEQFVEQFNPSRADMHSGIVGALSFRRTKIPVIDPALVLKTHSHLSINEKSVLILKGDDGNWALLVDRIDNISPADKFRPCKIPPLLKTMIGGYCTRISLLQGEPIVHFEPEQCLVSGL